MTLTIGPELEARLRDRASAEGKDPNEVAEDILIEGLEWVFDPSIEGEWRDVVTRRIAELDSGGVAALPAEEVHARLRNKFS